MILRVMLLVVGVSLSPALNAQQPDPDPASVPSESAQQPSTRSLARQIPRGSTVAIRMRNGETFRGRLVEATDDLLVVQSIRGDVITNREIQFADVLSIQAVSGKPSRAGTVMRYLLVGTLGGAVGVGELARQNP
jgi:hypothetical protein